MRLIADISSLEALFDPPLPTAIAKVTAADAASSDYFGRSVALNSDPDINDLMVGADGDDDHGSFSGSAYIYPVGGVPGDEETKLTAGAGLGTVETVACSLINSNVSTCNALPSEAGARPASSSSTEHEPG